MNIQEFYADIHSDRVKKIILDTDTYNEIDDQFALSWAVLDRGKHVKLASVNAAPFHNQRSTSAGDGMEKSYREIENLFSLLGKPANKIPAYRGSASFMTDLQTPVDSDAARNIVKTVKKSEEPVYVVAIGALTNVASALLLDPSIKENMALVWLGGHAWDWPDTYEFNMHGDVCASRVVMDSGVPFLQIPCMGVCDHLTVSVPELERWLKGTTPIADYLSSIVCGYTDEPYCWSKVIWDISAIAALALPDAVQSVILPTPILTADCRYSFDAARAPMLYVRYLDRDKIFRTLFRLLTK